MPVQPPKLVGGGSLSANGDGPKYRVYSVSNLVDRDAEYHIPYTTELIQPGTVLIADGSMTFRKVMAQARMDGPIAAKLKDYVLCDVHAEGGEPFLIFARDTPPDFDTYMAPSLEYTERDTWRFPAIMRKFGQPQFGVNSGNLLSVIVEPDIVDEYVGPCDIVIKQWWTVRPWPANLMRRLKMQPTTVDWNYFRLAIGSLSCLHPDIDRPPLSGVTALMGQPFATAQTIQGRRFPKSNVTSWIADIMYDKPQQIRGRFFREQKEAQVPSDPTIYPKAPYNYTS